MWSVDQTNDTVQRMIHREQDVLLFSNDMDDTHNVDKRFVHMFCTSVLKICWTHTLLCFRNLSAKKQHTQVEISVMKIKWGGEVHSILLVDFVGAFSSS